MLTTQPVELALIGAGSRGELNLGYLAKRHAAQMRFVGVAERDDERRRRFVEAFRVPSNQAFDDWEAFFAAPRMADAVVIALPCHLHYRAALTALRAGYHVLLEKPMAHTPAECVHLALAAEQCQRQLVIALQCRYNRIYSEVARLLDERRIGRLLNIDCAENIGYWHFIMSYVRGMHSRSCESHSFLLAKAIHDLDLLNWFSNSRALRVSSFGRLSHFVAANAPPGAPLRCTDGCPAQATCEYDAVKQYVDPGRPAIPARLLTGMSARAAIDYFSQPRFRTLASTVVRDISRENVLNVLREGPHGRCVFRCDNDVMDHQVINIEYENDVVVSFSISAFSLAWERTCNFHGTRGEIRSADFSGRLEVRSFNPARVQRKRIRYHGLFHGGGDESLLVAFAKALQRDAPDEALTRASNVVERHLLGFAAEEARRSNVIMDMQAFRSRAEAEAQILAGNASLPAGSG